METRSADQTNDDLKVWVLKGHKNSQTHVKNNENYNRRGYNHGYNIIIQYMMLNTH